MSELIEVGYNNNLISATAPEGTFTASVIPDSEENREILCNMLAGTGERLKKHKNEVLFVEHLSFDMQQLPDSQTGELRPAPRICLRDVNGVNYQCTSIGIATAMRSICRVYGNPPWNTTNPKYRETENGLPLIVGEDGDGTREYLTIKVVPRSKK